MATKAIIRVAAGRLAGVGPLDAEAIDTLKPGVDYVAEFKRAKDTRSIEQNNLRFKVCQTIADNVDGWDKDSVNDALKVATGHFTVRRAPNGTYWRFPKPTDFEAMGSAEFSAWLDKAFAQIGELFGPELSEAVWAELDTLINPMIAKAA